MHQLVAHAQSLHTNHTPLWFHIITEPYIMSLLFGLGAAGISWAIKNVLQTTQLQRLGILIAYCLLGSALSFTYNKPLSLAAFSLAVLSSLAASFWFIQSLPSPKKKAR